MTYAMQNFDTPKEVIVLFGRECEVVFTWECRKVPADRMLPNGRLDLSKYEPVS